MNEIKPYERKVYYYETDKMSVMHHSNYIRIFEETRVSYLLQAGMTFKGFICLFSLLNVTISVR